MKNLICIKFFLVKDIEQHEPEKSETEDVTTSLVLEKEREIFNETAAADEVASVQTEVTELPQEITSVKFISENLISE
ncbi:MAG: hypothetical protein PUB89_07535 [Oscillospiraceae bacterium]|nr:hypothetical protein [Oscillospiraceae bacterium]